MLAAALALAAATPSVVYVIDPRHRIVEGIATDGETIWLSSVIDRTIIACRRECRPLVKLPAGPHPFALAWDSARNRLWVAADCPAKVPGITECERGALLGLDRAGRIRSRLTVPTGSFHPGDVSIGGGRIFVSDSANGMVREAEPKRGSLVGVVPAGQGKSGQGTALSADGKTLIVADYSLGVGAFVSGAAVRTALPRTDGKPLRGIDGLVRAGQSYYAVYNGASPGALLRLAVGPDQLTYEQIDTDAFMVDPTQLAVAGKSLLVVADSGWATIDKERVRAKGATIIRVPLP
ncbi:MAG: hypothetical protein ABIR87_06180 [Sphingomicrobium sp.]